MKGGYVLFDVVMYLVPGGDAIHKDGIYDAAKAAVATGKPIWATNCYWGAGSTKKKMTPVPVQAMYVADDVIMVSAETIQVYISENDSYTVSQL